MLKYFTKYFFSKEFLRFAMVGTINTISSAVFSLLYRMVMPYRPAFVSGYATSLIVSYLLNTYFTFHQKPSWRTALKFPFSYLPNFLVQYLCIFILVEQVGLGEKLAYFVAAVLAFPITFLVMKLFAYSNKAGKRN